MRAKMQKKKYPKHLSLRDIEVVIFIAEAGAISLSTLGKVLEKKFKTPLEARGLRALAHRLVDAQGKIGSSISCSGRSNLYFIWYCNR